MQTALLALLSLSLLLLAAAALHDVMVRTVPNAFAAGLALAGLGVQALNGSLLTGVVAAAIVFGLAYAAWRLGLMGGGDVKLLGAAALVVAPAAVPGLIVIISFVGAALALVYLLARRRIRLTPARPGLVARVSRIERWRMRRGGPLPYAVAIAGGAAIVVVNGGML